MPHEQLHIKTSHLSITFRHICQWVHFDHAHIYCNFTRINRAICILASANRANYTRGSD